MALGFVILGWVFGVVSALLSVLVLGYDWLSALGIFSVTGSLAVVGLITASAARQGLLRRDVALREDEMDAYWAEVAGDAAWSKTAAQTGPGQDAGGRAA